MTNKADRGRRFQVGCQGWSYDDWVTKLGGAPIIFPHGTRQSEMLAVYARAFETVEVDSTFYAIPATSTLENWHKRTPPEFTFSLKLPREITHERMFGAGSDLLLTEFCERARGALKEKLGCVLIQTAPSFQAVSANLQNLDEFLSSLPRDLRFSVEFRHDSWARRDVAELLSKYNVSVALVEGPWIERRTLWQLFALQDVDFAYVRWMGERDLTRFDTVQRPQDANLELWTRACDKLRARVPQVYAYFSNFYEGYAPASANKLKSMLGESVVQAEDLQAQPTLFT